MANQASWLDKFPHMALLDSKSHLPLLVDVGDNVGHDMERFRESHPETAARFVTCQIEQRAFSAPSVRIPSGKWPTIPSPLKPIKGKTSPAYLFRWENPPLMMDVGAGARAFYMHGVLHDWADEPARKILAMQREALTPGYSTLLIHNHIVSEAPAHPHTHGIRSDDDGHGGRRGKDRGEVAAAVDLESVADRYVEQSGKQKCIHVHGHHSKTLSNLLPTNPTSTFLTPWSTHHAVLCL